MLPFFCIMKYFVLLLAICIFSCKPNADADNFLELSVNALLFPPEGGKERVIINSNLNWVISSPSVDWVTWEYIDDNSVQFNVNENCTDKKRVCNVEFKCDDKSCFLLIEQKAVDTLSFIGGDFYTFSSLKDTLHLEIKSNVSYKLKYLNGGNSWISLLKKDGMIVSSESGGKVSFQIENNQSSISRQAHIVVYNETRLLSDTVCVFQAGNKIEKTYEDGMYGLIKNSLVGNVDLVVLGDGFTKKDLNIGGVYEKSMYKAIDYFFSIEPYNSYRDYFNIYMVIAESAEEGVGEKKLLGGKNINNKFGTAFGDGTEIVCNNELIFEYARKVKEIPEDKPITVLVVLNSSKYAGTAYLYPEGNSIALCPMSTEEFPNDFEGIVHHEAGGHAFGFLLDEYVYNQRKMPDERKEMIREWQEMGYHMNLDFTDDLDKILWKDFIGINKYTPVGAYEGGYEYQYGVWRSEENSCMNNNIPYYNVQSRWAIVKRIMDLSDIEFSIQDFIKNDFPEYPTDSRALNTWENFVPLGTPVWGVK